MDECRKRKLLKFGLLLSACLFHAKSLQRRQPASRLSVCSGLRLGDFTPPKVLLLRYSYVCGQVTMCNSKRYFYLHMQVLAPSWYHVVAFRDGECCPDNAHCMLAVLVIASVIAGDFVPQWVIPTPAHLPALRVGVYCLKGVVSYGCLTSIAVPVVEQLRHTSAVHRRCNIFHLLATGHGSRFRRRDLP